MKNWAKSKGLNEHCKYSECELHVKKNYNIAIGNERESILRQIWNDRWCLCREKQHSESQCNIKGELPTSKLEDRCYPISILNIILQ